MRSSSASVQGVPVTSSSAKYSPRGKHSEDTASLPKKSIFIMPLKGGAVWPFQRICRHSNQRPVQSPVLLTIVEYFSHFVAHNKAVASVYRGVASVEKTVDVLAKQDAIGLRVRAAFGIWANMGGIQCRKNLTAGQRALTLIEVGYHHTECALPQSRNDQDGLAISGLGKSGCRDAR